MTSLSIDLDQLSEQSGLPSYVLDYFDLIGFFSPSINDVRDEEGFMTSTMNLANRIADMRGLGFSLGQIASILEPEVIGQN